MEKVICVGGKDCGDVVYPYLNNDELKLISPDTIEANLETFKNSNFVLLDTSKNEESLHNIIKKIIGINNKAIIVSGNFSNGVYPSGELPKFIENLILFSSKFTANEVYNSQLKTEPNIDVSSSTKKYIIKKDSDLEILYKGCSEECLIMEKCKIRAEIHFLCALSKFLLNLSKKLELEEKEEGDYRYFTLNFYPLSLNTIQNLINKYIGSNHLFSIDSSTITLKAPRQCPGNVVENIMDNNVVEDTEENIKHTLDAKTFLNSISFDVASKVELLEDVEYKLIENIDTLKNSPEEKIQIISELFNEYASTVYMLYEFQDLTEAIFELSDELKNISKKHWKKKDF